MLVKTKKETWVQGPCIDEQMSLASLLRAVKHEPDNLEFGQARYDQVVQQLRSDDRLKPFALRAYLKDAWIPASIEDAEILLVVGDFENPDPFGRVMAFDNYLADVLFFDDVKYALS